MTARVALLLLVAAPWIVGTAAAQEEAAPEPGAQPSGDAPSAGAPSLGIDALLRPRMPVSASRELRGGRDRRSWLEAFAAARGEVAEYEETVAETQAAIRAASRGDWGYTPAGGGVPSDPEVQKLSARLKRDRQSLEAARQRLRDLEVEASLLGVPDEWRDPPSDPEPETTSR